MSCRLCKTGMAWEFEPDHVCEDYPKWKAEVEVAEPLTVEKLKEFIEEVQEAYDKRPFSIWAPVLPPKWYSWVRKWIG